MKKIIAVDFDGTVAITNYPEIICPIQDVIDYVKSEQQNGATIILWTCRHGKDLDEAVDWCKEQGLTFDYTNENMPELIAEYGDCRKIYADEYIDDKAINIKAIIENVEDTPCNL